MISLEDKNLLASQSANKTLSEWCDYFGNKYTKDSIYSYCHRNNYAIKKISEEQKSQIQSQNARKYKINQDYFKTWSHNMAYVLGLWFADGCIYGGKMFDITLHKKDKYILKRIAEELEYEGNLYDYVDRQAARLNFSCVVIYKDIISLGGKESKSMDVKFPQIPREFLHDFIRGYFDGDGCVMRRKGGLLNTAFTCGSYEFLSQLWEILKQEAGVTGGSYDKSCYTVRFGNKDSLLIGKYLYQDNPELFLIRKKSFFYKEDIS